MTSKEKELLIVKKLLKLSKIIEQNYSHLMPVFFEMQTEYLASLNIIYHDLDASLVAMVLTSELYKNTVKEINSKSKISLKSFYQKDNFKLHVSAYKIYTIMRFQLKYQLYLQSKDNKTYFCKNYKK